MARHAMAAAKSVAAHLSPRRGSTVAQALSRATRCLRQHSETPRLEAELLLSHVLERTRASLYAHPEWVLEPEQLIQYNSLLRRRTEGEPLPYLVGHAPFYGLDLAVSPDVLIPRPETETLVELALDWIGRPAAPARPVIVDVGTGSGAIAIALAVHVARTRIWAVDLSAAALDVARVNARRHQVQERITFLQSDLLAALPEPAHLIVANPPYIAAEEWAGLPPGVRIHEPRLALYGGRGGLDVLQRLLQQATTRLREGGAVLVEIGASQGAAAVALGRRVFPSAQIEVRQDLAGRGRVLVVQT